MPLPHFQDPQVIVGLCMVVVRCKRQSETLIGQLDISNTLKPQNYVQKPFQ